MVAMEGDQVIAECPMLSIPTELIVIVISFLSSRERVNLRYVSQRLQIVSEVPSLWREFVWDYYDTREELCVKNVLKRFGEHIRRLAFPGYLTPKLDEMLQFCNNVRQVSLPVVTTLSPDQLILLGETVQHMKHLHTLEVGWDTEDIKPLLLIVSNLKELTVYRQPTTYRLIAVWVNQWVGVEFRPPNLNTVFFDQLDEQEIQYLAQNWQLWNPKAPNANFKLYRRFKVPLNVSQIVPLFQLQFGQTAVLPFVQAKQCGIEGMDYLLLTDCYRDSKMVYRATNEILDCPHSNSTITTLRFITHFDVMNCRSLLPSHLEQLAIACPNLQQLKLFRCIQCLRNLQGLRAIAGHCHNLRGLKLLGIPASEVESKLHLWEILSNLKLIHLTADYCIIRPGVDEKIFHFYQKCSSLVALYCRINLRSCRSCRGSLRGLLLVPCQFPSLGYLKISGDGPKLEKVDNIITSCKELRCFSYTSVFRYPHSLSYACNSNLQQLSISSRKTILLDSFMNSVSAHGGLVHVFLSVASVSVVGISMLIENSPKLMTFYGELEICHENSELQLTDKEFVEFECTLKQKYHNHKIFNVGGFIMLQKSKQRDNISLNLKILFLRYTDLEDL